MPRCLLTPSCSSVASLFFFPDTRTTELYTFPTRRSSDLSAMVPRLKERASLADDLRRCPDESIREQRRKSSDRKSTRLNSSHVKISYAVFCLKKKKEPRPQ